MTRKSKSRKRNFGSTVEEEEKTNKPEICKGKGCQKKMKDAVKKYCNNDIDCNKVHSDWKKIHTTYKGSIRNTPEEKQLNACRVEKKEKCKREDTKPEVLLLTDEKDPLKDLEKDFPDSKESSISFPNIDKVNKKLSDLFDYIEKNTMEEFEEKEELEKRKVEAEIELTKAETKQAISESERINNFGTESNTVQQGIKYKVTASMGDSEDGFKKKLFNDSDKERFFNLIDKIGKEKLPNDQIDLLVQYINIIQVLFRHKGSTIGWEKNEWSEDEKKFFDKASSIASENISIRSALEGLERIDSYHFNDIHNLKTQNKNEQENIEEKKKIILDNKNAINPLMKELQKKEEEIAKLDAKSRSIERLINIQLTSSSDGGKLSLQRNIEEDIETNFNKEIEGLELDGTDIDDKYNKLVEYLNKCETRGKMSVYDQINKNKDIDDIYIKVNNLLNLGAEENKFKEEYDRISKVIKPLDIEIEIPEYNNDKTLTENVKSCNESVKNNINQELEKEITERKRIKKLIQEHENDITAANDAIETSKQNITRNEKDIKDTIEAITNVKNVIKEDVQRFEQSLSRAMKFGIMLKEFGIENEQVFLEKNEDFFKEQLIEKYKNFKLPFETDSDKEYIKKYKRFIKECVNKEIDDDERKQAFILLSDELNKFIILNFPVKSIINLSTFLQPPDEKSKRDIFKVDIDPAKKAVWAEYIELLNKIDTTDDNEETKENIQSSIDTIIEENPEFKEKTDDWDRFLNLEKQITNVYNDNLENDIGEILQKNPDFRFNEESSILNVEFLTLQDTENNDKGKIINILGEPLPYLKNWMYNGTKGPFYKIFHTSNDNSEKKQYKVNEDLRRLLTEDTESSSCDHITFAGYGFSGSGKTFTLIEGTEQFGYTSVINQIKKFLNDNETNKIKINIYEKYIENVDTGCTPNVNWKSFSKINKLEGYITGPININELDIQLHNINEQRKIKVVPDNTDTISDKVFRTSIRKTTYNPESSRAHLFVDIEFKNEHGKNKKITVMDMAGAEKVDVIQNDYFISENKKTFNNEIFNNAFVIIIEAFKSIKKNKNPYDYLSGVKFNTANPEYEQSLIALSTTNLINQRGGKDNYIIPDRWKQLFFGTEEKKDGLKDLLGKNDEWKTEHEKFINDYNNNQYTTKFKILIDFIDSLKELEDTSVTFTVNKKQRTLEFIKKAVPKDKGDRNKVTRDEAKNKFYNTGNKFRSNLIEMIRKYLYNRTEIDNLRKRAREIGLVTKKKDPTPSKPEIKAAERKKYLPFINFAEIEGNIYNWEQSKSTTADRKYLAMCGELNAGSVANKWGDVLEKLQDVLNGIKTILEKDLENKDKIQSKIRALGNTGYEIKTNFNPTQSFEDIKQSIKDAERENLKWNKTMITKYHCPLRFQGKGIMGSINEFKTNLQGLNNQKDKFTPDMETFPYNVDEWVGPTKEEKLVLKKKNFVIFTNIRLDFNKRLCEYVYDYPKYVPICNAYDTAINFSHELLYSENTKKDTEYNKEALKTIFDSDRKFTKKRRRKMGRKVSKKTSTRSFRKRGRRRGPSETEIL